MIREGLEGREEEGDCNLSQRVVAVGWTAKWVEVQCHRKGTSKTQTAELSS